MNTKHTPGPWKTMLMENGGISINMAESDNYMSLAIAGCYGNYEQNEANAKLIAAAPELLEALNDLVTTYKVNHTIQQDYIDKANELINKLK